MAKLLSTQQILNDKTWFQEIYPTSFYNEDDLERAIILNLETLFSGYYALPFKKALKNNINGKDKKPDLALIRHDYKEWYIIEVELAGHDIQHIKDQIDTFYNADITDDHANYMYNKRTDVLNRDNVIRMIRNHSPKLMVIINENVVEIESSIQEYECLMCVFQVFLDQNNNPIYRLNGKHPLVLTDFCHCKITKNLPFMVEVLDGVFCDTYGVMESSEILISYNDKVTKWCRVDDGRRTFLTCKSTFFPLNPMASTYMLSYNSINNTFNFSIS